MLSLVRRARVGLDRAYARAWRAADRLLPAVAPRSARQQAVGRHLLAAPVHRHYGLEAGQPIDRLYIERFLERYAADLRGRVLELLDDTYTRRFGGAAVTRADVLDLDPANAAATIHGDLQTGSGIPRGVFDCVILTQTISITYDFAGALDTAHAALAPGGVLLLTVPGISHQSAPDEELYPDHWRFTWRAVERLLSERFGREHVAVGADGTVAACAAFLYGMTIEEVDVALLDPHDPDYEMVIWARAVKPAG